jgi:hypothetical protein
LEPIQAFRLYSLQESLNVLPMTDINGRNQPIEHQGVASLVLAASQAEAPEKLLDLGLLNIQQVAFPLPAPPDEVVIIDEPVPGRGPMEGHKPGRTRIAANLVEPRRDWEI